MAKFSSEFTLATSVKFCTQTLSTQSDFRQCSLHWIIKEIASIQIILSQVLPSAIISMFVTDFSETQIVRIIHPKK
jgi:hypothetical protein